MLVFDNEDFKTNISRRFKAKITLLNHSTTIRNNYQPLIHCGLIRQTAKLKIIKVINNKKKSEQSKDKIRLRTGTTAIVIFTFNFRSEYLEKNTSFFFRDGTTKGYGKILKVLN